MKLLLPALVITNSGLFSRNRAPISPLTAPYSALGLFSNIAYGPRFKLIRENQFREENPSDTASQHAVHQADLGAFIMLGWAWWFLFVNTAMTVSIIARIR